MHWCRIECALIMHWWCIGCIALMFHWLYFWFDSFICYFAIVLHWRCFDVALMHVALTHHLCIGYHIFTIIYAFVTIYTKIQSIFHNWWCIAGSDTYCLAMHWCMDALMINRNILILQYYYFGDALMMPWCYLKAFCDDWIKPVIRRNMWTLTMLDAHINAKRARLTVENIACVSCKYAGL